jgi:type III restriction enzyme
MPEVVYWVRNLPRRNTSFRLQTSKDWFYPDFICQREDGRILVVEYKGEYLYSAEDAEEKRAIGEVWASRSHGHCLFVMPTGNDFQSILEAIKH